MYSFLELLKFRKLINHMISHGFTKYTIFVKLLILIRHRMILGTCRVTEIFKIIEKIVKFDKLHVPKFQKNSQIRMVSSH